jgi:hypothetical protein
MTVQPRTHTAIKNHTEKSGDGAETCFLNWSRKSHMQLLDLFSFSSFFPFFFYYT